MPVLEWHPAARADLFAIVDYISDDNIEAAQRLKDEIETRAAALIERPKMYRAGRVAGTREMVVRSNYVVVYAENERAVTILRVLHGARQWPP
ncbi:type II toxin-antitoxin system RelE/ParE family toxin [Methylobacterium sp. J-067]|uniref:type II toxin-antitoxin system RelE/ParE family toxin n=1 Tax=Methylobacterium sp. J-067 TaxID=2836648 RepID=UPI001FBBF651|nr:type II toxin-antitoxin system RelE/ParE family toxin [Methylobacterium sp. J-067]MCJ2026804.1 type II toxin-antitoxin system RelE/ParE family toxin [Methylobacterium sp. J-067]